MFSSIANLNLTYLIHLSKNGKFASEQFDFIKHYLVENLCTFRGNPMPTLLKPNFISYRQTEVLTYAVEKISSALSKFIGLYGRDERVREKMNFSEKENFLFSIDPGYTNPLVISRLDAFMQDYTVKFLEFNCDSPAGPAYSDVMEDGFKKLFRLYPFLKNWEIHYHSRQQSLMDTLIVCYNEFRQQNPSFPEKPVIAITDWADVSTLSEFQILKNYFEKNGYKTVICSPQQYEIRNGKTIAAGEEVHLIYRRVITRELIEKWDEVQEFVHCISEKLACCCNSFRSYIAGNKKILDMITDPEFQHIYSVDELSVIQKTIPWTKILADKKAVFKNVTVHLRDFIAENKDILVLKPANLYGGKNVYLGPETTQDEWEKVMNDHLEDQDWVVQEYVEIPQDIYPEIGEDVTLKLKKVNINPYAFLGRYSGTITRVSDSSVINVSAGGGLVPTLSVAPKKDILTG